MNGRKAGRYRCFRDTLNRGRWFPVSSASPLRWSGFANLRTGPGLIFVGFAYFFPWFALLEHYWGVTARPSMAVALAPAPVH